MKLGKTRLEKETPRNDSDQKPELAAAVGRDDRLRAGGGCDQWRLRSTRRSALTLTVGFRQPVTHFVSTTDEFANADGLALADPNREPFAVSKSNAGSVSCGLVRQ